MKALLILLSLVVLVKARPQYRYQPSNVAFITPAVQNLDPVNFRSGNQVLIGGSSNIREGFATTSLSNQLAPGPSPIPQQPQQTVTISSNNYQQNIPQPNQLQIKGFDSSSSLFVPIPQTGGNFQTIGGDQNIGISSNIGRGPGIGPNIGFKGDDTVYKSVFVHVAPEDDEVIHQKYVIAKPPTQYKIIFIKSPTPKVHTEVVQQLPEHKTIIYVLSKKPELAATAESIKSTPPKPEVYFIKYKSKTDPDSGPIVINSKISESSVQESSDGLSLIATNERIQPNLDIDESGLSSVSIKQHPEYGVPKSRHHNVNGLRHFEEKCPLYVEKEIEEARSRGEADEWEISGNCIQYGSLIGEGAFGRVFIARLETPNHPVVAVKKLKDQATSDEVNEFLGEIKMLKFAGKHPHVISILGCCTIRQPYCIILEYAERGDLSGHLRKLRDIYLRRSSTSGFSLTSSLIQPPHVPARPSVADTEYTLLESESNGPSKCTSGTQINNGEMSPTLFGNVIRIGSDNGSLMNNLLSDITGASLESDAFTNSSALLNNPPMQNTQRVLNAGELHSYALQIAKGMEHLEKKGITHRDLAARNVLIDAEGRLKISDLGLSKTGIYVTNNRRKVPLRWLALEAIRNSYYSSKSDVWSYAVLLWEIGTLGGFPYPNLSDHQILPYLSEGRRLDKPIIVSQELYATMVRCWTENPEQRPNFSELVTLLEADESKNKAYLDITTLQMSLSFPPVEDNAAFDSK